MTKVDPNKYNRREVRLYFWPNANKSDLATVNALDEMPQAERGTFLRTMVNAGVALQRIDPRLPMLLSAILNDTTTSEELMTALSLLMPGLKEQQGTVEELAAQVVPPVQEPSAGNNLKGLLGK